jgi:hypothetical protein
MYGIASEGTTTDLYTEFFGPRKPAPAPQTATAAAQPVQPVTAAAAPEPLQPATGPVATQPPQAAATRQGKPAAATASARQVVPSPTPVEVAQQQPSPQPEPEPDVPTAYGITANGPTTDLYTAIFGPRRSNGQ